MRYTARSPLRLDLGGAWSCLPAYAEREGGASLCLALAMYAEGSIALPTGEGVLRRLRSDRRYVSYTLDLPLGAGLGASSAQTVLYVALLRSVIDNAADREEVARTACQMQLMLGTLRGRQDVYASALGGAVSFDVTSDVELERLQPAPSIRDAFADRSLLLWSGAPGRSHDVAVALQTLVQSGDSFVLKGLAALKRDVVDMRAALKTGEIDALAGLVDEQGRRQRELLPHSATPETRDIEALARAAGAIAVKPCGVSGGMMLVMTRMGDRPHVGGVLAARGIPVREVKVDMYGVHLKKA